MEGVQKITEGFESLLTDKDKKKLAGYMQKLGFEDISTTFYKLNPESGRKVSNKLSTETILRPWKMIQKHIMATGHLGFILKFKPKS